MSARSLHYKQSFNNKVAAGDSIIMRPGNYFSEAKESEKIIYGGE